MTSNHYPRLTHRRRIRPVIQCVEYFCSLGEVSTYNIIKLRLEYR